MLFRKEQYWVEKGYPSCRSEALREVGQCGSIVCHSATASSVRDCRLSARLGTLGQVEAGSRTEHC
jgi:hypothetical protein